MLAKLPGSLVFSVLLVALIPSIGLGKQEPAPPFEPTLPWLDDFDEALAAARRTGKPILVEFR